LGLNLRDLAFQIRILLGVKLFLEELLKIQELLERPLNVIARSVSFLRSGPVDNRELVKWNFCVVLFL